MSLFLSAQMVYPLLPTALMLLAASLSRWQSAPLPVNWSRFIGVAALALLAALGLLVSRYLPMAGWAAAEHALQPCLRMTNVGAWMALLVQLLGTVIAAFSARYLQGESGQTRYQCGLAGVLAAVHLLLLADHWLVLIAAWAGVGMVLQSLLCFYSDRPFAMLAAHKKRLADRLADLLLLVAAAAAWSQVGSGSFSALSAYLDQHPMNPMLQLSAVSLVLAVILRTALLPVHGWLIQVMEAPTPVSALLHAGVVNLGGFILIRFAPLLDHSPLAKGLLVVMGLATALLAGMVMLTRISIKVRLAWSTVAQMGFMLLECGLGLYTLALLHLLGHSLYKAHTFLAASGAVQQTRRQMLRGDLHPALPSLLLAPLLAIGIVWQLQQQWAPGAWPWWWSALLGLAWAPLLWLPRQAAGLRSLLLHWGGGALMVLVLASLALLAHHLPLGLQDAPDAQLGLIALAGMAALYICLALLQAQPQALAGWRRWSYAGFYVDEFFTRLVLRLWPTPWAPNPSGALAQVGTHHALISRP